MKSGVQLGREVAAYLAGAGDDEDRPRITPRPRRDEITGDAATSMPRFEFIARWLVVVTRKKSNRGPLGLHVRRVGKQWRICSPIGGGTVTFATRDASLLFDYARRGQLGADVRDADAFRVAAFEDRERRASRGSG